MKKTDTDMQNTVITVSSIDAEYYAIYPQVTRALPYQQLMQLRLYDAALQCLAQVPNGM